MFHHIGKGTKSAQELWQNCVMQVTPMACCCPTTVCATECAVDMTCLVECSTYFFLDATPPSLTVGCLRKNCSCGGYLVNRTVRFAQTRRLPDHAAQGLIAHELLDIRALDTLLHLLVTSYVYQSPSLKQLGPSKVI